MNSNVFQFDGTFNPILKPREFIRLMPREKFLRVKQVSPIGYIEKNFGSLATVTDGSKTKMETEMKVEDTQLAQFRLFLLDGFRLSIYHPQATKMLGVKDAESYLYKNKQIYPAFDRDNSADTEVALWTTTSPRTAKIVGMQIDNETANAQIVRLGDGATGGGSDASAANADWSIEIGASQSLTLTEKDCPKKEFVTGIAWQHSAAQQIRISLDVLEERVQPYGRDVLEMFVYQDEVPYFQTYNETAITLGRTRVGMMGWKYEVEVIHKDKVGNAFTDVPFLSYASP